jgi:endonuclease YncB( thermonuclease family)
VPENDKPPKPQPFQMHDSPGLAPSRQASRGDGQAAAGPPPRQLAGRAEAIGADALRVDGRDLRLFGVQPPAGNDRCDGMLCTARAQAVLAGRLSRTASCRFPAPGNSAAICLDGVGVDLGGLLVGEGLALADRSQSFDYVGAESIAKSQKRGLWQLR